MAKSDLIKFRDLYLSDISFQEKLRNAAEAYTGEKDEKAVFDNVLVPLAGEYGLSATYEEFKEFAGAFSGETAGELSEDELSQVAGGKGDGLIACAIAGLGIGHTKLENGTSGCFVLGVGAGICVYEGITSED